MTKRGDFPVWTRNRAQRHLARGCSHRFVGLILRPVDRRLPLPEADAWPSNVLPFRSFEGAPHCPRPAAIEAALRPE